MWHLGVLPCTYSEMGVSTSILLFVKCSPSRNPGGYEVSPSFRSRITSINGIMKQFWKTPDAPVCLNLDSAVSKWLLEKSIIWWLLQTQECRNVIQIRLHVAGASDWTYAGTLCSYCYCLHVMKRLRECKEHLMFRLKKTTGVVDSCVGPMCHGMALFMLCTICGLDI